MRQHSLAKRNALNRFTENDPEPIIRVRLPERADRAVSAGSVDDDVDPPKGMKRASTNWFICLRSVTSVTCTSAVPPAA